MMFEGKQLTVGDTLTCIKRFEHSSDEGFGRVWEVFGVDYGPNHLVSLECGKLVLFSKPEEVPEYFTRFNY